MPQLLQGNALRFSVRRHQPIQHPIDRHLRHHHHLSNALQGLAVRPEHRMIGHTGFLITARRLAPETKLPQFKTRTKAAFEDEDIAVWNPEHLGERNVSDKKLRKTVRKASAAAVVRAELTAGEAN